MPFLIDDVTEDMIFDKKQKDKNKFVCDSHADLSFGCVPENGSGYPSGEVRLKLGSVGFGPERKKAFGLRHIHEKHCSEFSGHDVADTIRFIESILRHGASVLWDKKRDEGQKKLLVLESRHGLVSIRLQHDTEGRPYYSIVTAYERFSHPGVVIGSLQT